MSRILPPDTTPSFERSAKPLSLALKPSRLWFVYLLSFHGLLVFAVLITALIWPIKLVLLLLVLVSLHFHYHDHLQPIQIIWRSGNRWFVENGTEAHTLTSINFFSRWLVILTISKATEKSSLWSRWRSKRKIIMPFDALEKDTFRQLRVRLRIESTELLNPQDTLSKITHISQHNRPNN